MDGGLALEDIIGLHRSLDPLEWSLSLRECPLNQLRGTNNYQSIGVEALRLGPVHFSTTYVPDNYFGAE